MSVPGRNERDIADPDRRRRILSAAEFCFARSGFHRATIQDVATEAGMSPGNLYRYFPSKDAIVAGLAERDRAEVAADFAALERAPDFLAALAAIARKHLADAPREKAALHLEIWAEAARNPAIAEICSSVDGDVGSRLTAAFTGAQQRGQIDRSVNVGAAGWLAMTLADGMIRQRAHDPDFDAERSIDMVIRVIGAVLAGFLPLGCGSASGRPGASS
jgi:AcrR family transcriptional regulator